MNDWYILRIQHLDTTEDIYTMLVLYCNGEAKAYLSYVHNRDIWYIDRRDIGINDVLPNELLEYEFDNINDGARILIKIKDYLNEHQL